jgi:hypothetical protein
VPINVAQIDAATLPAGGTFERRSAPHLAWLKVETALAVAALQLEPVAFLTQSINCWPTNGLCRKARPLSFRS